MYYCNNCGVVIFLNRSENANKPRELPSIQIDCMLCKQTYRKLLPEHINSTHQKEFDQTIKAMYNEILRLQNQDTDVESMNDD